MFSLSRLLAGFAICLIGNLSTRAATLPSLQVPRAKHTPAITAAEDDPAWNEAARIDGLQLSENAAFKPKSTPQTTILLKWDLTNLYVRFICEGDDIFSPFSGRDAPYYKGDVVEVFLDPKGDAREFVEIEVSPNNGVLDQIYLCTARPAWGPDGVLKPEIVGRDMWVFPSWNLDGLRTAAGKWKLKDGSYRWIVDMAIPAVVLRRTGRGKYEPMTIRANFLRYDFPLKKDGANGNERNFVPLNWSPVAAGRPHRSPGRMGYLQLVETSK